MFYHLWDFILASADYLLIVLTLVVAVIGIAWPQTEDSRQPTSIKRILTFAVVLIGIVSVLKIYSDNRDKSFLQLALSSTLLPAGSVYDSFYEDVSAAVAERAKADKLASVEPKAVELIPWHGAVGMIAIIKSPIEGVLVLDKSDVGLM